MSILLPLPFSIGAMYQEFKTSLKLSLPLIASEMIYGLGMFISTAMVAHLGRDELAANALGWAVAITIMLLFVGILCATGILVAQSYGAKDSEGVHKAANQGIILSFLFAIPMMVTVWVAPEVLVLTGQNPHIIAIARPYFHAWALVMLPLNLLVVIEQCLIGIGKTRLVLFMSIIAVPLQIIFFYLFVFGKFGFPRCNLSGIAYGMATAYTILNGIVIAYVKLAPQLKLYNWFSKLWVIHFKYFKEIVRVGLPLGGMFCVELGLFAAIAILMGRLGTVILAAHQIAYQYFLFALTIIFGLSQGVTARIGNEVGRNNKSAVKLAAFVNILMGVAFMLIPAILYIVVPDVVMQFDIDVHAPKNRELVHYAATFLAIAGCLQLSDSVRIIAVAILRGLKDTKIPMFISIVSFWLIAFPCAYLLGFPLHLGGVGIWLGLVIGLVSCAIILLIRYKKLIARIDLASIVTR